MELCGQAHHMLYSTNILFQGFLPISINSLDDDSIIPTRADHNAVSNDGVPAIVEPAYGATKNIPAFPNILETVPFAVIFQFIQHSLKPFDPTCLMVLAIYSVSPVEYYLAICHQQN